MHDDLIYCGHEWEMKHVLGKYDKRQTNENIEAMTKACKLFKADDSVKPHNRKYFYEYLEEKNILDTLE